VSGCVAVAAQRAATACGLGCCALHWLQGGAERCKVVKAPNAHSDLLHAHILRAALVRPQKPRSTPSSASVAARHRTASRSGPSAPLAQQRTIPSRIRQPHSPAACRSVSGARAAGACRRRSAGGPGCRAAAARAARSGRPAATPPGVPGGSAEQADAAAAAGARGTARPGAAAARAGTAAAAAAAAPAAPRAEAAA
jgi:hypothetical protein